jgi:hypothetical protein
MRSRLYNISVRAALMGVIGLLAAGSAISQDNPQSSAASKSATFGTVAKTDAIYTGALDAHDKEGAVKLTGKKGAFKGTVSKVFAPRGGNIVILNFDDNYKTAMTAVLKKSDFSKFPDVSKLVDQEIVVSGKFIDYKGSPEIELSDVKQIAIVK